MTAAVSLTVRTCRRMCRTFSLIVILFGVLPTTVKAVSVYPETSCFDTAVPEGSNLYCDCTANDTLVNDDGTVVTPSLFWLGVSGENPVLSLTNVRREMNGSRFTCIMRVIGQPDRNVSYALQVAYGPFDVNTFITGPGELVTNGSNSVSLTCSASNTHPRPGFSWTFVACDPDLSSADGGTCVFTPKPEQTGPRLDIVCTATNPVFPTSGTPVQASATFALSIKYAPKSEPKIFASGGTQGSPLKSGNTITCRVAGGNPLVSAVILHCTSPSLADRRDYVTDTSVSSSVIVDTSQATTEKTRCTCTAVWSPDPEMYSHTVHASFYLEYRPTINTFTINYSNELLVIEDETPTVDFRCEVIGRLGFNVTLQKQGNSSSFGRTQNLERNVTAMVERKLHTHTITSVRCEDTGVFTCKAHSGYLDASKKFVRLVISCGPRFYNGSMDPPPLLTSSGLQVHLVAHPVPRNFKYSFLENRTALDEETDLNAFFEADCQRHDYMQYLSVCTFKRNQVPKEYYGLYNVTISNAYGIYEFRFQVDRETALASFTTLTIGIVSAVVGLSLVVLVVAMVIRQNRSRGRYRHGQAPTGRGGGDVECTRVSHRRSTSGIGYPDNDPSVPFTEVKDGKRHDKGSSALAEVRPHSSDIIFAIPDPKKSESTSRLSPHTGGDFGAPRDDSLLSSEYKLLTSPIYAQTKVGSVKDLQSALAPDTRESMMDEASGYESLESSSSCRHFKSASVHLPQGAETAAGELSPLAAQLQQLPTGSQFSLESKTGHFITTIFLPTEGGEDGEGEGEGPGGKEGSEERTTFGPQGDEYSKVRKVGRGHSMHEKEESIWLDDEDDDDDDDEDDDDEDDDLDLIVDNVNDDATLDEIPDWLEKKEDKKGRPLKTPTESRTTTNTTTTSTTVAAPTKIKPQRPPTRKEADDDHTMRSDDDRDNKPLVPGSKGRQQDVGGLDNPLKVSSDDAGKPGDGDGGRSQESELQGKAKPKSQAEAVAKDDGNTAAPGREGSEKPPVAKRRSKRLLLKKKRSMEASGKEEAKILDTDHKTQELIEKL